MSTSPAIATSQGAPVPLRARFATRLVLVLILVGGVPLGLMGVFSSLAHRRQLLETLGQLQAQSARELARSTNASVLQWVEELRRAAEYLPLEDLPAEEVATVLHIPYRQLEAVNLLVLVDAHGNAVAPAVYAPSGRSGRAPVTEGDVARFSARVPFQAALDTGGAIGPPYAGPGGRVAMAVRVGKGGRVLLAELSLAALEERVAELRRAGSLAYVVDAQGEPVVRGPGAASLGPDERALVAEGLDVGEARARTVRREDGSEWLAAFARAKDLGWGVVVGRPAREALAATDGLARVSLFWAAVALVATLSLGGVLARGVSRPVAELSHAVAALTEGRYERPVPVSGNDELGRLGAAFNHMAREVQRRDAEIRRWGEELRARVEERTRQLREAEEQVARARRLAGLGTLSAGVAHELNNPLTAVIGMVTLARQMAGAEARVGECLTVALEQSRRMARIIVDLGQLADREREGGGVRLSPRGPVLAAVEAVREECARRNVALSCQVAEALPDIQGHADQLQQGVGHLLRNALTAMPEGGSLAVGLAPVGGEAVRLWVRDSGRGIAPENLERIFDPFFTTKDEPGRLGLGLSVTHQIVEAHHGRIQVESRVGQGSTFTLIFPAASAQAHLC
ncbi:ATP-binding protein [Myxococcaceae bacterium GXIMD 01537]